MSAKGLIIGIPVVLLIILAFIITNIACSRKKVRKAYLLTLAVTIALSSISGVKVISDIIKYDTMIDIEVPWDEGYDIHGDRFYTFLNDLSHRNHQYMIQGHRGSGSLHKDVDKDNIFKSIKELLYSDDITSDEVYADLLAELSYEGKTDNYYLFNKRDRYGEKGDYLHVAIPIDDVTFSKGLKGIGRLFKSKLPLLVCTDALENYDAPTDPDGIIPISKNGDEIDYLICDVECVIAIDTLVICLSIWFFSSIILLISTIVVFIINIRQSVKEKKINSEDKKG